MKINYILYQALQVWILGHFKSHSVIYQVFIQRFKDDKLDDLLSSVKLFFETCIIDILDMVLAMLPNKVELVINRKTSELSIIVEWIFYATIDFQLQELNDRFSEHATQLLILFLVLNSFYTYESFKINHICQIEEKTNPKDFTEYLWMNCSILLLRENWSWFGDKL